MFGYIMPEKLELKLKEYYKFKGYYCGLCLALKKRYGQLSRFLLNYDSTFLGIILVALSEEKEEVVYNRCIANPFLRKPMIKDSKSIDYAADINLLLAYHKLLDDWQDEKSLRARLGILLLQKVFKKASNKYSAENILIKDCIREISTLEEQKSAEYDKIAEIFGKMLEKIFNSQRENEIEKRVLGRFGFLLGEWIYLIDAFDDLENDINNKSYNPFLIAFNYNNEAIEEFMNRIGNILKPLFIELLVEIAKTYDLLDIKKNKGIIENIIYVGMLNKTEQILENKQKRSSFNEGLLRGTWCGKRSI